jgi:hypothetical protein
MRYTLSKLNYNEWNDALDLYLKYKERKPSGKWHDWYMGRVEHVENLSEMGDQFPIFSEDGDPIEFDDTGYPF